jgi:hypothetical protein
VTGVTQEEEAGLDRLRAEAAVMREREPAPWWIGYRVWIGLNKVDPAGLEPATF